MNELNSCQLKATEDFIQFMHSDSSELIISGAAGTGKTFLMKHLIEEVAPKFPRYTVALTATLNKAAHVLSEMVGQPAKTIHSFLNLKPKEDFKTGKTTITKNKGYKIHFETLLFIDEYSYIDSELLELIRDTLHASKIVYLGDKDQLNPINASVKTITELTTQMRTKQAGIKHLVQGYREAVTTSTFPKLVTLDSSVIHLSDEEAQSKIDEYFYEKDCTAKILVYTNTRVKEYTNHISYIRKENSIYNIGSQVICSSFYQINDRESLHAEQSMTITDVLEAAPLKLKGAVIEALGLQVITDLGSNQLIHVCPNDEHLKEVLKHFIRLKDWRTVFQIKGYFADIRGCEVQTTHKAQGSTYDTVFIDLTDISKCTRPDIAARLLYVATSRAKNQVYLIGNLTTKYGG
jgi:ATP-dependent exoDNAse (exonuclease V) alpha subunit